MTSGPIGVFDSGAGGLSILSGIHELLPRERLVYVADSAHAPYGPRDNAYIRQRCETIMAYFLSREAKAVVVACNTATGAAIADLRRRYPLPIIGVEPAIKPAAAQSGSGVVGVLATSGTIASDKFFLLQNRFNDKVQIVTCPCHGLVEAIETPHPDMSALRTLLSGYIKPLLDAGADTLVLGCTHYSLIKPLIQDIAGAGVAVMDTGAAVAREVRRRLEERELLNDSGEGGVEFLTSGDPVHQSELLGLYWGATIKVDQFT